MWPRNVEERPMVPLSAARGSLGEARGLFLVAFVNNRDKTFCFSDKVRHRLPGQTQMQKFSDFGYPLGIFPANGHPPDGVLR